MINLFIGITVMSKFSSVRPSAWLVHVMSAACGSIATWGLFGSRCSYMACLVVTAGTVLTLSHVVLKTLRGPLTCVACVAFLIAW